MNRGAWQTTVHGAAKSQTPLSTHTHDFVLNAKICTILPPPNSKGRFFILESDSFSAEFQNQNFQGKRVTRVSLNVDLEKMYTDKPRVNPK